MEKIQIFIYEDSILYDVCLMVLNDGKRKDGQRMRSMPKVLDEHNELVRCSGQLGLGQR
jgi:hypothetical protein